jgi:hypothetical protein
MFAGGAAATTSVSTADPDDVLLFPKVVNNEDEGGAPPSGFADFSDVDVGNALTMCPQAGEPIDKQPKPLQSVTPDKVAQLSSGGDDNKTNQDYACFPQDETSIAVDPTNPKHAVAGANDYRLGFGTSGFYVTTDNGNHWYDGIKPFPTSANSARDHVDGGGDPAIVFDRQGTAYYNDIHFARETDENGVFVARSTNGGFTWSRPCIPAGSSDDAARCGGRGDVRRPGDGVVNYFPPTAGGTNDFNDKNYMAAGPRPEGVTPVCFAPISKTVIPGGQAGCPTSIIGPDRLYVTWTIFTEDASQIYVSYSDDRAYSWSPPRAISGSAPFCTGAAGSVNGCDDNQFSTPTVNPTTGFLYVSFENFNTPDENQYLTVRSRDGGQTFEGPFFVSTVFDVNYPRSGQNRQDCRSRGQGGRSVLTNSCFRVNSGGNVVVDRRGGEFADDLYLVFSDNRNGQRVSSNADVFMFTSKDGGTTWIGPTRVNDDPSQQPTVAQGTRDCGRIATRTCPPNALSFGNDQWFPWIDISDKGDLNVVFYDRRLDTNSTVGEWPESRAAPNGRPGNYLVWNFGAQCSITSTATVTVGTTSVPAGARQCLGNEAAIVPVPTASPNPSSGAVIPGGAQTVFPFRNFNVSDTASNWDYTFRAGIFAGDYNNVAVGPDSTAWAFWTDARNGRSARTQAGRNPICEQSDVFDDEYSAQSAGTVRNSATQGMELYLATPCPLEMQDRGANTP